MHHSPSTPTTLHQHQGHQDHHINTIKFIQKPKTNTQKFQTQLQHHHCHNQQLLLKIIPNLTTKPLPPEPTTTSQNHHHHNSYPSQPNSNCQNQIRKTNPPFSMAITHPCQARLQPNRRTMLSLEREKIWGPEQIDKINWIGERQWR